MDIDRIAWQAKINKVFMVKFRFARGMGFFQCPRGQRVGSAPNVHRSP